MTFYAWTISRPGRQDVKEVSDLAELRDYLCVLDLPTPPDFVERDGEMYDHGRFIHQSGSIDEWSLRWTKVDGETKVIG
jgi:hypothetical protein